MGVGRGSNFGGRWLGHKKLAAGKQRRRPSRPVLAQPTVRDSVDRERAWPRTGLKRQTLGEEEVEARQKSQLIQNLWVDPSYELRDLLVTCDPQTRFTSTFTHSVA
jgi:hypothetical protein